MSGTTEVIIEARDLRVVFEARGRRLAALSGVSFDVFRGETLAVVGESGSGKSTLARALLGLRPRQGGTIRLLGQDVPADPARMPRALRRKIQPVFQDPSGALDPRFLARETLFEPMSLRDPRPSRTACEVDARRLLADFALDLGLLDRFPHEMSVGQKQRLCIARALAAEPEILVLDEPLSALDVSLQAQILALLARVKRDRHLTFVLITHDLTLLREVADRVLVLYRGHLVEVAQARAAAADPRHPYTRALIEATPEPDPIRARARLAALPPEPPSTELPARGCVYAPRCPLVEPACQETAPPLKPAGPGRLVACPPAVRATTAPASTRPGADHDRS